MTKLTLEDYHTVVINTIESRTKLYTKRGTEAKTQKEISAHYAVANQLRDLKTWLESLYEVMTKPPAA